MGQLAADVGASTETSRVALQDVVALGALSGDIDGRTLVHMGCHGGVHAWRIVGEGGEVTRCRFELPRGDAVDPMALVRAADLTRAHWDGRFSEGRVLRGGEVELRWEGGAQGGAAYAWFAEKLPPGAAGVARLLGTVTARGALPALVAYVAEEHPDCLVFTLLEGSRSCDSLESCRARAGRLRASLELFHGLQGDAESDEGQDAAMLPTASILPPEAAARMPRLLPSPLAVANGPGGGQDSSAL